MPDPGSATRMFADLEALRSARPDEPMKATWGVSCLVSLGHDTNSVETNWRKLAGRPVGSVRALLLRLEGEREELHQLRISEFARTVKATHGRKR